jgi:hypothetical protein
MLSDNTQRRAVNGCLTKHNLADVHYLMVLFFVVILWKYEYGGDLAVFSALAIFPSGSL